MDNPAGMNHIKEEESGDREQGEERKRAEGGGGGGGGGEGARGKQSGMQSSEIATINLRVELPGVALPVEVVVRQL